MSGHSKWATIKHAKGLADAKRGKIFTKFIKEISIAARMGGGDPNSNPRLRTVIIKARAANMPKDNIERAIKKGTGEDGATAYEELVYEGYAPGGVAVMVEVLTDNHNRAAADVRNIFTKNGGNLGTTGSVSRMFQRKGTIVLAFILKQHIILGDFQNIVRRNCFYKRFLGLTVVKVSPIVHNDKGPWAFSEDE